MAIANRISFALVLALTGCTTFQPTQSRQSAPAPTPYTPPDAESVRHQPVHTRASAVGRYDRVIPRLRDALAGRDVRIAVFWDSVIPETDGGWQADSRIAAEVGRETRQPGTTTTERIALSLSRQVFRRPSLEAGAPRADDPVAAFVLGRLLAAGATITDLKLAALRAQPELDQDEVYRRIRALIDQADLVVEVFVQGGRVAVRVRDVREARLRAIANESVDAVIRQSRPARILDGADVDPRAVDEEQAAVLAVVATALRDALAGN